MSVKASTDKTDLEYQYTEDQLTEELTTEPAALVTEEEQPTKRLGWLSKKKILLGVLVVVIIGGIFQYLNKRDNAAESGVLAEIEASAKMASREKAVAPQPVTKRQATVTQAATVEEKSSFVPDKPVAGKALFDPLENNKQLKQDESQIVELQSGLQEVNHSVSNLQNTLTQLTNSMAELSDQMEKLTKAQAEAKVAQAAAQPVAQNIYYLKAIIPGRAWLETPNGDLMTVKVGDELAGYGTVVSINPEAANVTTSSGTVIKHGPNDS